LYDVFGPKQARINNFSALFDDQGFWGDFFSVVPFLETVGMRGNKFIFCSYRQRVRSLGCELVSESSLPRVEHVFLKFKYGGGTISNGHEINSFTL
jgi:hypothetical protein